TDTAIDSGPTVASRATILGGNAVRIAAQTLAKLLDMAAADLLNCQVEQLLRQGERYIGPSEEPLAWELAVEHARQMGLTLSARGKWAAPAIEWDHHAGHGSPYFAYHFGAQIAEVAVDSLTGKVEVVKIWAAHDVGKVIFPEGALGQVYGGIAQGLGYALTEGVEYANGYIQNINFDEYIIPTAVDVPEIEAQLIEHPLSHGPFGAKNLAEPTMVPAAPAILNAIAHALGRRIRHLPANLERITLGKTLKKQG
ncbi:MAG TPA: xanthine dehydrogenase family protein molybdopterin-binding subunit, partial [Anaerolineae bacterium]|nr:xanthine dehydrogenase family protein molybdopterin-binding subunit [Anaerolineae bacterium]